ncbi:hypothetical protein DRE_00757 [Drechslerella stenobrocha 248]|uniref:RRM domain-containing protein n=1 Tax=Drechslerella stenobrocha 248 TaxID=1043628 RepID=W7HZI9_9PEZI|nr:hypothetical protein DRE_00757 [Drechslerella stenobrocha 248]
MAAKATRKSPVIASTPLKTPSYEDDTFDFSSPATASGGSKCPINLHIAPLPPTMTDSQLLEMVAPFGEIISHKAILDRPSRECKGYGFAKFADHDSAQACIEALTEKNYYVTIARDSFYSKLKDLADEGSTNLYVSNLPVKWDEDKIVAIFKGYEHTKCRLLVNTDGSSKGVAFIDFKDRKICDEIIERFNGIGIAEEEPFLPLQVRYADTVAQKKLKKEKQMVGQFPKKSVLANHKQALDNAQRMIAASLANTSAEESGGVALPAAQHQFWRNTEAPPTPPRSDVSNEEDK